jgi:hypothetical protein
MEKDARPGWRLESMAGNKPSGRAKSAEFLALAIFIQNEALPHSCRGSALGFDADRSIKPSMLEH